MTTSPNHHRARDGAQPRSHAMTKSQVWKYFDRMQKSCMASDSMTTKREFFAEPEKDQKEYYRWMCIQSARWAVGPYWH